MSDKKDTTHIVIDKELIVYQRERSTIWQCRYCIDRQWQRTSTKEYDLGKAKKKAKELFLEAQFRKRNDIAPITRYFKDIAKSVVKKLKQEIASGNGKAIYKDYISAITNYFIPALGKYYVDSIDYKALEELDKYRVKKLQAQPTRSTLLTHNAALSKVLDEAIYKGYMLASRKPELKAKGKKSERRTEFTRVEATAIKANFDKWIEKGKADSKEVRALLKDFVITLLDTGARPGKELLALTWAQVELEKEVVNIKTGVRAKLNEDDQHGEELTQNYIRKTLIINIQKSKTGARKCVGRLPSVYALNDIAQRNYGKTLEQMIKSANEDLIFTYKEFVSKRQDNPNRTPQLVSPTSFSKLFDEYLKQHNLLISPITNKKRVLYSLRHTYATLALTHDKVSIHTLAKQMGTSVAMIEQHYSHLDAVKAMAQLRGEESRQLLDLALDEDDKKRYAYTEEKNISNKLIKSNRIK
jgi:integrase